MNVPAKQPSAKASLFLPPQRGSRILLVGARRQILRLLACLDAQEWTSIPIVGYVDHTGRGRQLVVHPRSNPVPILGRLEHLSEVVDRSGATDVVVALSERHSLRMHSTLTRLKRRRVKVHIAGPEPPAQREILKSSPAWSVDRGPWTLNWERLAKRAVDFMVAAIALLILSPLLICVALAIAISSGRPIFYTQERVGRRGRIFHIWKFRSMRIDAESETGPVWANDHDERCTWIGDWLRHTNIDELPQLFNVLIGDMSLVGPRPERPIFVDRFRTELPNYDARHAVPVGMTGWAQVHGWRGKTSLRKRLQYDLDYIRHWSLGLDLRVLVMTLQHVFHGKTRWAGGITWLRRRRAC